MQEVVGLHRVQHCGMAPVDRCQGARSNIGSRDSNIGSRDSTSSEGEEAPMDLSSGGVTSLGRALLGEGVTSLDRAFCGGLGLPMAEGHPLLNARRLAELVRQQHKESEAREEREGKRPWQEEEENQEVTSSLENQPTSLIPLHLIRAKWKKCRTSPDLNAEAGSPPASPAASSGSESGREVKKRRLDELLSRKFERVASQDNSTPLATPTSPSATPASPIASDPITLSQIGRRLSEEKGSTNRRKQSHPTSPKSPPALTIKSHADLFPPATSTPRDTSPVTRHPRPQSREQRPVSSHRARSPRERSASPVSVIPENSGKEELLRNQILQMQLASAGGLFGNLSGSSPPLGLGSIPGLGSSSPNPLQSMYYSYYAQMLQNLQAQQKLLELNLPPGMPGSPAPSSPASPANLKNLLSPLRLAGLSNLKTEPRQSDFGAFSPLYSGRPSPMLPSPLGSSSIHSGGDNETRRRAPRALTGRYVKTGTAASPKVLQILRKKVEDRLRLKELLGDNSQIYFGAVNKHNQQKQQQQHKFKQQIKANNNVIKHVKF